MNGLAEAGAALLGGVLRRAEALHGGDLSQIMQIRLADGREAIVKNGPAPKTEAAMLRAIAAAGAPAPAVLAVNDEMLVIERLENAGSLDEAWGSLGTALATLHETASARYGWHENYAFATVAIDNEWSDHWPDFWAERRLLTHLPQIPSALGRRVEALAADLPNRLPKHPAPALLHGDLWGGNLLVSSDRVSGLIDPACYYGHSEADIAMLGLFGRPGAAFYEAYGPLEPGYQDRMVLYRLWPALVHLRLFGGSYASLADGLLSQAGYP